MSVPSRVPALCAAFRGWHRATERSIAASLVGCTQPRTQDCETCGSPTASRRGRYCSPNCRPVSRPGNRERTRPASLRLRDANCAFCDAPFTTAQTKQLYCSEWCSNTAQSTGSSFRQRSGRVCPYCGDELPVTARSTARFCGSGCQNKHNQYARRARRKGLPSERFDRSFVFARDRWLCHLCGTAIDPLLRGDMMSASVDHIVPLAWPDSPGHVLSNVAAAHLRCNISKGAGALVGRLQAWPQGQECPLT
jgi:5-methylcytosine-specific restriction endonuclease McrA